MLVLWGCSLRPKYPIKFGKGVDFAKRALHIIFFKPFRYHAVPSFNMSNILPFQTICSFMHDFVNNLTPPNVSELFSYSSEKHHYYTRSSAAGNLYLKHLRTEHMKNSLSRLGARIWNSTPICLCSLLKCKFKRLLHRQLLNILMRENTNVDVHILIDKFRK